MYIYIYIVIYSYIYIYSSGMEVFAKTVNNWMSFAVFADISILDV